MLKEMNRREFLKASVATGALLSMTPNISLAQEPKSIQLLKPQIGSSNSLMQLFMEEDVVKGIQPQTLARRGPFKSPVGGLRD